MSLTTVRVANAARSRALNPKQFAGVHKPDFKGGVGLASATGLAVDVGNNLVAAVAGVTGQGDMKLPFTLDRTLPFAAGFLVEIGATDDGGRIDISIISSSASNYGVLWSLGAALYSGSVGASQNYASTPFGGAVAPGLYEFYVHSDGTRYRTGIKKFAAAPIVASGASAPGVDQGVAGPSQTQLQADATNPAWANCNTLRFKTSSITHKIHGGWVSLGSVTRPPNAICGNATHIPILTPTDYETYVMVPKTYDGRAPIDLILVGHPNGSAALLGTRPTDLGGGVGFHAGLRDAGYLVAYVTGDAASLVSAGASSWGSNAGMAPRVAFLDYLFATYPQIRNVYWLGQSMGFLDGLNLHLAYPGLLRAIVGVSGVCNLSYAYGAPENFKAFVDIGHGTSTLTAVVDRDPLLRTGALASLPMQGWHGTSDTTVHKTNHQDTFAAAIVAAGGSFDERSVTGGGHLDATMMNGVVTTDVIGFLQANAA